MRQIFLEKGAIVVKQACEPVLDEYSVLVDVHYSFISSGTEAATVNAVGGDSLFKNMSGKLQKVLESLTKHGVQGTRALIKGKLSGTVLALGYSASGRVVAVGARVTKFKAGDFVACAGAGFAHHADMVAVPEQLVVHVEEHYLRQSSVTTIGAIALQGLRRADVQLGDTVCVLGLGLLGQLTVQMARASGCTVIGIDIIDERLELARTCGAEHVFNGTSSDVLRDIEFLTQHQGVDVTLVTAASSSSALMQQAMQMTRKKGKVVIVGDVGLDLQRAPLYQKEIDVLMSCSYGPGRYDAKYELEGADYPYAYVRWTENRNMQAVVRLISSGVLRIDELTTQISVEQAAQAYEDLKEKKALGVVVSYLPKKEIGHKPEAYTPARLDGVRVGFIGAGGFAKTKLMPIVAEIKDVSIQAIVDADGANALNVSRTYAAARALTRDQDLFTEDVVDAVVISTPHIAHADQIIRALEHGKAVFAEKPMVTSFEQLDRLAAVARSHTQVPLCVDFNRSFSPFMRKVKHVVHARTSPLMIYYRMNAGFISKDHWVQRDVGAGRLIGEACHIFDLFCSLTAAQPVSVSVEAIRPSLDLLATDNFSAAIRFSDGSVCTLLYTALGHAGLPKERMEIFFDGKAIVMDDYLSLQGYGLPASFNQTVSTADKGHAYLLESFFAAVRNKTESPMNYEYLHAVSSLTLVIDELVRQGGGDRVL